MPYTKAQLKSIRELASCGVPMSIIAEYLGVPKSTLYGHIRRWPTVGKAYHGGAAKAKNHLIKTAYNMAVDKKNTAMVIFLLKARCGFREHAKDVEEDVESKASLARETLERMNMGLKQFQAPDGAFQMNRKTESSSSKKKTSTSSSKKKGSK